MRIDKYLAKMQLAKSREAAQHMLREGLVLVDGRVAVKPSLDIDESSPPRLELIGGGLRYVSRGGLKLERALDEFGVDVSGLCAVDIGASTGGFTDCLLQRGAKSVCAVDVGRSQLDAKLAVDSRVTSLEGVNARYMTPEQLGGRFMLAVCDVSFISLTLIFPAVRAILPPDGRFIALIKPQFEAGRANIGKNGIVKDRTVHEAVIDRVLSAAEQCELRCAGLTVSPITGGDGNREYLALFDNVGGFDRAEIRRIVHQ